MSFRVTVDIFSGRTNPSWDVNDPGQISELVRLIMDNVQALAATDSGFVGLGFRGVRVEMTEDVRPAGLPLSFKVGGGGSQDPYASARVAEAVLDTMPIAAGVEGRGTESTRFTAELRELIRTEIQRTAQSGRGATATIEPEKRPRGIDESTQYTTGNCPIVSEIANKCYWNSGSVQRQNNCYNFAVNYVTPRFAQPGRAGGEVISDWTCTGTTNGALADGLRRWNTNCYQSGSKRYKVALVVGTNEGEDDYHWYRLCSDGYWWHKPGSDKITNRDNRGNLITNPETADRGFYTHWCGYMQTCNNRVSP